MEKMQIAICDDEKEIRELLAEKVARLYPQAQISLFESGGELLLAHRQPDILLLDIGMPEKNGMDTARELRRSGPETILIFITALEEYVYQAFDVGAFHYLVKPFPDEKFAQVMQKAAEQVEERKRQKCCSGERETPDLIITAGGQHITVSFKDIVYAEVFNRKIMLRTMDSDIEYYGKMKELEEKAGEDFYRPHRAYLVNFRFIRKYDAATIYMERGEALVAKKNYREFVKSYLRYIQRKVRSY